MSAFQQALASPNPPNEGGGNAFSIRGAANGAPSARSAINALRSAGIRKDSPGMDVDGGGGRPDRTGGGRGRGRGGGGGAARSSGPLDQSGRPPRARNDAPYSRPPRPQNDRDSRNNAPGPSRNTDPARPLSLASRLGRGGAARPNTNPRRQAEGTPPMLRTHTPADDEKAKKEQAKILSSKLRNEKMKDWLRNRVISPGVMDMSKLPQDEYLRKEDIVAPGHRNASPVVGTVFWRLIDMDVQKATGINVHTLSLANNELSDFGPLDKLAYSLPHIRALDLSNNPVKDINELDILLARGEKKGNAMAGNGSLKSLIELKLNGCEFRETMLQQEKGDEKYQHEILRRFPGLLILDGVNLNRIIFPIERKPKVYLPDDIKRQFHSQPLTFPTDVQGGFIDNEMVNKFVMAFCAKFFPLFDTSRADLLQAYSPTATLSVGFNPLKSRSHLALSKIEPSRLERTNVPYNPWTDLPGRNLFRLSTMEQRLHTLKSPVDGDDLSRWWHSIPATKHPLTDPSKWCIDSWVLDGEGVDTKLCAMIQGEFLEMPSGSHRSFSRTFILADASQGTAAHAAGWPCQVLSDTLIVHPYLSTEAFDHNRSVAIEGVTIVPPQPVAIPAELQPTPTDLNASTNSNSGTNNQDALVAQLRQATGMNVAFAKLCLEQNGWEFEVARRNFEEIKGTIPPEAFQ